MPTKKTAVRSKETLQRNREEQWRRRVAAQGGVAAAVASAAEDETDGGDMVATSRVVGTSPSTRTQASGAPRSRVQSPVAAGAGAARRTIQPKGSARLRMAANSMSLDDEMSYVRSDIRRLIILTALCLAVLIALTFVIR